MPQYKKNNNMAVMKKRAVGRPRKQKVIDAGGKDQTYGFILGKEDGPIKDAWMSIPSQGEQLVLKDCRVVDLTMDYTAIEARRLIAENASQAFFIQAVLQAKVMAKDPKFRVYVVPL